jgi:hypothetical protein
MSRVYTCTYANCQKTEVPILVTSPMERARFCCFEHAAMAMIRRARIADPSEDFSGTHPLSKWEMVGREIVGDGK